MDLPIATQLLLFVPVLLAFPLALRAARSSGAAPAMPDLPLLRREGAEALDAVAEAALAWFLDPANDPDDAERALARPAADLPKSDLPGHDLPEIDDYRPGGLIELRYWPEHGPDGREIRPTLAVTPDASGTAGLIWFNGAIVARVLEHVPEISAIRLTPEAG